jgi:alpha-mannosidase
LSINNSVATYNWDVGTIQRSANTPKQFEVASHQWFDLSDKDETNGVTILSDCKYGSDKPDDHTLRLTLIYTPGLGKGITYPDQATQDWGRHEFLYGLTGHAGDWRYAQTDWQAYRLNQPLIAFQSPKHAGTLGKIFSLLRLNNDRIRVLAVKKTEKTDEVVVRVVELDGRPAAKVRIGFAAPVVSARELNGQELALGTASVANGEIVTDFTSFQIHTFAVKLAPPNKALSAPRSQPVPLPYDISVATLNGKPATGCFDCPLDDPTAPQGNALPAEMMPTSLDFAGVHFRLAPATIGKPNAVTTHGQVVDLPTGNFNHVYVLGAAAHGDQDATFLVDDKPLMLKIQEWTGKIGQWDNRTWETRLEPVPQRPGAPEPRPGTPPRMRQVSEFTGRIMPGYIKRADVAWYASHRHSANGSDEPYSYSYVFVYGIDVSSGARRLTLPDNPDIRVMAISTSDEVPHVLPAQPLYDTLRWKELNPHREP